MPSAVIREFSYDEERNELAVAFVSGKIYVYSLVPEAVAAGMAAAFSKGEYFNTHVRDRYPHRQVREDLPPPPDRADTTTPARGKEPSLLDKLKASRED